MLGVRGLVVPLLALILTGFVLGKRGSHELSALGWMNTFVVYVALPALFFKLMSKTPVEQFGEWHFVLGATGSTFLLFAATLAGVRLLTRATMPEAMIQGFASAYGNIGYMGPGLALVAFGEQAAVPVALIFCFDNALHFTMAPTIMALSDRRPVHAVRLAPLKLIVHPLLVWVMLSLTGNFPSVWVYAAMLMASLPSATNVFVLAQQYETWTEKASAAVLFTTCLSIASVSLLIYLAGSGWIAPDLLP